MFQHRIEDGQQFPHAGGERHLFRFAARMQALVEGPDHRIEAGRDDGTHVEDRTDLCVPAPDRPSSSKCAAVVIEWGHADKGCDLLVDEEIGTF